MSGASGVSPHRSSRQGKSLAQLTSIESAQQALTVRMDTSGWQDPSENRIPFRVAGGWG